MSRAVKICLRELMEQFATHRARGRASADLPGRIRLRWRVDGGECGRLGNAVPVKLAEAVARSVRETLRVVIIGK